MGGLVKRGLISPHWSEGKGKRGDWGFGRLGEDYSSKINVISLLILLIFTVKLLMIYFASYGEFHLQSTQ